MKKGWKVEKLGDVCDIVNGSTPLRSNKSFWENGDVSWFTIDDIRTQGRKITETKQKVTQTALERIEFENVANQLCSSLLHSVNW